MRVGSGFMVTASVFMCVGSGVGSGFMVTASVLCVELKVDLW